MKKNIALLLSSLLLASSLLGCNSENRPADTDPGKDQQTTAAQTTQDPTDPDAGATEDPSEPDFGSLSGTDVAKLLLARARMDSETLMGNGNLFLPASFDMKESVSRVESLSAASSSNGIVGFSMTDTEYVWSKFDPDANMASFFQSYFTNIENCAKAGADLIDQLQEHIGITDCWIGDDSYSVLLEVSESAETLYERQEENYLICRRSTNASAQSVYEIYADRETDEYMVYIPDARYEYHSSEMALIAENQRGYWNMFVIYQAGDGYNMQNLVVMEDAAYVIMADLREEFYCNTFIVMTPDLSCDIVSVSGNDVTVYLNGYSNVDRAVVSRIEHPLESGRVIVDQAGQYAVSDTPAPPTVYLQNGTAIVPGTSYADGNLVYEYGVLSATGEKSTGQISLRGQTDDVSTLMTYTKAFLQETGLSCRTDFADIAAAAPAIGLIRSEFGNTYKWNGQSIATIASVDQAFALRNAGDMSTMASLYDTVKDAKQMSWNEALPPTLGGINFAEVKGISAKTVAYQDGVLTVDGLTLELSELALLDEGNEYTVRLAIAKVADGSNAQPMYTKLGVKLLSVTNALATDGITVDETLMVPLTPSGEELSVLFAQGATAFAPSQSGSYSLITDLVDGTYTVVAYVCTAEEHIRISELIPLVYGTDLSETLTTDTTDTEIGKNEQDQLTLSIVQKTEYLLSPDAVAGGYDLASLTAYLLEEAMARGIVETATVERYDATTDTWVAVSEDTVPTEGERYRMACVRLTVTGDSVAIYVLCDVPAPLPEEPEVPVVPVEPNEPSDQSPDMTPEEPETLEEVLSEDVPDFW
ncbi:MAG: hypothetical protein IJX47_01365 [Clostridia bacterium]|nr:hypothetical protein [Clostridia bacterium]